MKNLLYDFTWTIINTSNNKYLKQFPINNTQNGKKTTLERLIMYNIFPYKKKYDFRVLKPILNSQS
jgi:hypothetical protein